MYAKRFALLLAELKRLGRKAVILSVEYSLAPEFPYPKALNECVAAYRFLVHNLRVAPSRVVIGGDSAGGNLAIATAVLLRDAHEGPPAGLTLVSPWVSLEATTPSYRSNAATDMLQLPFLKEKRDWYLQGRAPTALTSPILADLADLPPAIVFAGGREVFVDDISGTIERRDSRGNGDRAGAGTGQEQLQGRSRDRAGTGTGQEQGQGRNRDRAGAGTG